MPSQRLEKWWYNGTYLTRPNRADKLPSGDTFITMVTEPTGTNTGTGLGGHRALDPGTDTINGNVTLTAGETLSNKIINGYVDMTNTSTLINCKVRGGVTPPSFASHRALVKVIDHTPSVGGSRAKLIHCDLEPQTYSAAWSSCLGNYGWETDRCRLTGTTDLVASRSNSAGNGLANCLAKDTWLGPCIQWDPDPVTDRSAQAYKGTHNDTWQLEGNTGGANDIRALNVTFVARFREDVGQPSTQQAYWNFVPTSMAAIVASPNTKDRVGMTMDHCFFYGGAPNCINLGGDDNPGLWSIVITNSKFERPGAPGVPSLYPQKALVLDPLIPRDGTTITGNTYMDNNAAVPISGG